jgi:16S rRNA (cytosine967-C5)-methyltransferase
MAGVCDARIFAHDIAPARMKDIPSRSKRAGVRIEVLSPSALAQAGRFDLVFADAPCSGSGSWRRAPEAKWALSTERLAELCKSQADVMDRASGCVSETGIFAYATCSLLQVENEDQVNAFLQRNPDWSLETQRKLTPLDGGDGFYIAIFRRAG